MKMKMPRPNGGISLSSDPNTALRAENKTSSLALAALSETLAAEELITLCDSVDTDDVVLGKRSKSTSFKPADKVVKFQVHPTDPNKISTIGAQMDPAVDKALCSFLRENWEIFAWHPELAKPLEA